MLSAVLGEIRERGEYRFGKYGSFLRRFAVSSWQWSVSLCKFEDHWALHLFCLWITLWRSRSAPLEIVDSWGFTYTERSLHLSWGHHYKIIYMPWSFDYCETEVMLADGSFVPYERFVRGSMRETPEPENRFRITRPYRYTLRSGEVQDRTATVTAERRSWCWRGIPFRWLRWPSKVVTSIDVQFSDEVGERTGSWKGGCVGCGYELLPNESPGQCLRRMESERVFR